MAIDALGAHSHHEQTLNLAPEYQQVLREVGPVYQATTGNFPSNPAPVTSLKVDRATLDVTQEQRAETPLEYRARLLATIQQKTNTYPNHDFMTMAARDGAAARRLEQDILREAPRKLPLRETMSFDATGRAVSEFIGGSPRSWMQPFTLPGKRVTKWKEG